MLDKEGWVSLDERVLCEEIRGVLEGWFPEFRISKKTNSSVSTHSRSDPLADRIHRASRGKSKIQTEMVKMREVLRDVEGELKPTKEWIPDWVTISTAYKPKAKKIRPVNENDGTGSAPGGKPDWYERSFARDTPQEHIGQFKDHLLPRRAAIPRGSRLTPERIKELDIGDWLWPREREMLIEMLINHEVAIAFDWTESSQIHEDVSPPIVIKTIEHKAWQEPSFPVPRALLPIVLEILRDRLRRGVLEYCDGPYRNPWFLVAKKAPGTYRLINAAMKLNSVSLRDANLPPSVDEFSEEFAGCAIASLIDFFSGYDQLVLAPECRDMTAFMTPLGLLRMTTPPQGATNSVAQFVRVVMRILDDLFPTVAMPFLDDIGVKGPYTTYDDEETLPGIRRYVYEHILNLDKTMDRIERAGACIGAKSQFCHNGMNIVGFICGYNGRTPATSKVIKILEWPACRNITEGRAFIGVCVYYRIWIKGFAIIAAPIYQLFRKNVKWNWGTEQEKAMDSLKTALTTTPALYKIQYGPGWGAIYVGVDASLEGWGGVIGQFAENGQRKVARYESGLWNKAERNYDATKRECRGVLKCLQRLRYWLYGVHFILETDAKVLVAQLNRAATDLPGALVTRWIAWIRNFDFEVRHVKGTTHTAADGLSRRPRTKSDDLDEQHEGDIDDWIAAELDYLGISAVSIEEADDDGGGSEAAEPGLTEPLDDGYSEHLQNLARFLTTLKKPVGMSRVEFRALKREATKYSVRDRQLWRNATKAFPPRLVIDSDKRRAELLKALHDEVGHRGRESTYARLAARYFWNGMYLDVRKYVASCKECQFKSKTRLEEALFPTRASQLFTNLAIDVVYPPNAEGYTGLVICRDKLSGWPEARALRTVNAKAIADFIWQEVICRHGIFGRLTVDGGAEFKKEVIEILRRYGVRRVQISAYNAQANGKIEGGHKPILNALMTLTEGGKTKWPRHLHAVLLAERTSIHEPTGHTPFYLVYGREAVLPIETKYSTWRTLGWNDVHTHEELLAVRARQIEMRDEDILEAMAKQTRKRQEGQEYWDETHNIRKEPINVKDTVLYYNTFTIDHDKSKATKLNWRWLGPYRVTTADSVKGVYTLEDMDGAALRGTFSSNRLKKFVERDRYFRASDEEVIDATEEERRLAIEKEARQLEEEEAQAGALEQEEIETLPKPAKRLVIQPPRISERRKGQYVRFPDDWGEECQ